MLKTQLFDKKRQSFQWRKVFGLFFLLLSSVMNLRRQFIVVQKLVWQLPCNNNDRFIRTWEVVENTFFWKKKAIFPVKKRFCAFFSLYIGHNKSQDTDFDGPQDLFDKYLSNDKFFSLGPKRSIAGKISKFAVLLVTKVLG